MGNSVFVNGDFWISVSIATRSAYMKYVRSFFSLFFGVFMEIVLAKNLSDKTFSDPHEILDGYASLKRHHLAKESVRLKQMERIPLKQGARVLDIGVGPGFYLDHWLKHSRPSGAHFTLFDASKEALQVAVQSVVDNQDRRRVVAVAGDFYNLVDFFEPAQFDVIFIGNTLEYIPRPVDYIRRTILPLLYRGGVLAIRDLDCSLMKSCLAPSRINQNIVNSRIENNRRHSLAGVEKYQNPFIGRDLRKIVEDAGLDGVIEFHDHYRWEAPFTASQLEYLSALHSTWYLSDDFGLLTEEDKRVWGELFDPKNRDGVFWNEKSVYEEDEFMVLGFGQ